MGNGLSILHALEYQWVRNRYLSAVLADAGARSIKDRSRKFLRTDLLLGRHAGDAGGERSDSSTRYGKQLERKERLEVRIRTTQNEKLCFR